MSADDVCFFLQHEELVDIASTERVAFNSLSFSRNPKQVLGKQHKHKASGMQCSNMLKQIIGVIYNMTTKVGMRKIYKVSAKSHIDQHVDI